MEAANPLGTEKIPKLLMQFSIPAIIGMVVNALYNVVDRIYIGHAPGLGANGLAGITIGFPIMIILLSIGILFGVGGATLFSMKLGAGKTEEAERAMGTVPLVLFGGLALGLANTIFPAIAQPFTRQITKNDTVALGHTGNFGYALSGLIGKFVGNKEKSTEDINFPKGLSFLRDSTVSITITMAVVYVIVALFAGNTFVAENLSGGTNYIIYSLQQAGSFAAGVFVILAGVRLILAEIVPAFKGISEKLVPNSIPALDCPIVFPYAPNAVLIGFLTSFVGGIVSLVIMVLTGTTVIIPGVVPHFFCGATAGVYGNATGGLRGAVVGSFVHGVIISFMPILLMPVMGELGFQGSTFSDTDYGVTGIFLGNLANFGGQIAAIIGILAVLGILIVLTAVTKGKKSRAVSE